MQLDTGQAQFNDTVGPIPDHFDRHIGKPATDHHYHLPRQTRQGLMAPLEPCAHLGGGTQHTRSRAEPSVVLSKATSPPTPWSPTVSHSCSPSVPDSGAD